METLRRAGLVTTVIGAFAIGFHLDAVWREKPLIAVWLFGWSIAPYVAAIGVNLLTKRPLIGALPAAVAVMFDVQTFLRVQSSTSSTAALDLFWTPILNVVVVVPLGALAGLLLLRFLHAHRAAP
jgi:hypothetical protein